MWYVFLYNTSLVTLTSPVQWTFRGFQLRAHRTSGDIEEVLGDFIETPPNVLRQFWYPVEKNQFVSNNISIHLIDMQFRWCIQIHFKYNYSAFITKRQSTPLPPKKERKYGNTTHTGSLSFKKTYKTNPVNHTHTFIVFTIGDDFLFINLDLQLTVICLNWARRVNYLI